MRVLFAFLSTWSVAMVEITLLKKAIGADQQKTRSEEEKYRDAMKLFVQAAKSLNLRLKNGITFDDYKKKVGERGRAAYLRQLRAKESFLGSRVNRN
jgi:hypothetical protein